MSMSQDDNMIPEQLAEEIEQERKQLALRKWLNQRELRTMLGIAMLSALLLLAVIIEWFIPAQKPKTETNYKKAWFYDLNTGYLFTAKSNRVPPIEAPSGPLPNGEPAGVRAYVFSYGCEPNESVRFVGFLEIPDSNVAINQKTKTVEKWGAGMLIRRPTDEKWVRATSEEGREILINILTPNKRGLRPRYYPPE